MGRKIFYLCFFLLFSLSAIHAGEADFPFEGGMTSDSIRIHSVKLTNFKRLAGKNSIQVAKNCNSASMVFYVSVPEGKTAALKYRVFCEISTGGGSGRRGRPGKSGETNSNVSFSVKVDNQKKKFHTNPTSLAFENDEVDSLAGGIDHRIEIETNFEGYKSITAGTIDNLSVHIHRYGKPVILTEAECDQLGEQTTTCTVCGKLITLYSELNRTGHKMVLVPEQKSSCMSNVGKVTKCEYCPRTAIETSGELRAHKFDDAGKCTVCGLHMPKCNADSTVYEINDAGEMRVLAELVSIGRIPGNIGVNINSDLEFSSDLPMQPLGTFDHPFQGVLNGNGHRIRGNVSYYQGVDGLGFVGVAKGTFLSHAVIANLIFDRGNTLGGAACVGGIVGYASDCDIINCASFGALQGTHNVGGIVGYADQQVSITNCASVCTIRTEGTWNQLVCGMPLGRIYNCYSATKNEKNGTLDELKTATLRHCFSTLGSGVGVMQFSESMVASETMIQALNEESETTVFDRLQGDVYPVPVASSVITAKSNRAIPTERSAYSRRAAMETDDVSDETSEKNDEVIVLRGYVNEEPSAYSGKTIEEVKNEDAIQFADMECVYIVTRGAPENARLYEPVSGGQLMAFESYYIPADSAYIKMREYDIVAPGKVRAATENVSDYSGDHVTIDQYSIADGSRQFLSRISFEDEANIVYKENVGGILRKVWSIETSFDDEGNATVTNGFSHNYTTGEAHLEYSYTYDNKNPHTPTTESSYEEYVDAQTNTIHIIYNQLDPATGEVISREHYILRASDQYLLESRTEIMINGAPYLVDGIYIVYDEEGNILQSVSFGPVDANNPNSEIRPYMYFDYNGPWPGNSFPTAIKMPTVKEPSVQKRMDTNVYDMQGRVVRRATDVKDPFNGLPRGIYIYQGAKYLKK